MCAIRAYSYTWGTTINMPSHTHAVHARAHWWSISRLCKARKLYVLKFILIIAARTFKYVSYHHTEGSSKETHFEPLKNLQKRHILSHSRIFKRDTFWATQESSKETHIWPSGYGVALVLHYTFFLQSIDLLTSVTLFCATVFGLFFKSPQAPALCLFQTILMMH